MKRVQLRFAWLVLVSVAWASLIDCPCALDLIEDGLEFETVGPIHFAQPQPPDRNDPLASRLAHRVVLARLQAGPDTPEPVARIYKDRAQVDARVLSVLWESTSPRPPPGA